MLRVQTRAGAEMNLVGSALYIHMRARNGKFYHSII